MVGFFFSPSPSRRSDPIIVLPPIETTTTSLIPPSTYDFPLSFSYDFAMIDSTYITPTPTPPSPPPDSEWNDVEGINDWVDLGNQDN